MSTIVTQSPLLGVVCTASARYEQLKDKNRRASLAAKAELFGWPGLIRLVSVPVKTKQKAGVACQNK